MIILGINDSHDSSACLIKDGKLLSAISEDRLNRSKNISSLPVFAIKEILKTFNIEGKDIDYVALATKRLRHLNLWNVNSDFSISDWTKTHEEFYYDILLKKKKKKIKSYFPNYKPSVKLGYPIKKIPFISGSEASDYDYEKLLRTRKQFISKLLKIKEDKIKVFDHHLCHALYGYYSNPNIDFNKKTTIVTSDAGGDEAYNSISVIEKNQYELISKDRTNLLGVIYGAITILLKMHPLRHPYKVMGLAPYASGKGKIYVKDIFLDSLKINGIFFKRNKQMKDFYTYFKDKLKFFRFDAIAGGLQEFIEIRLLEWFKNIHKKTKSSHFVFSGGVANNVKANKLISELKFVKTLYIPPGPGDESTSIGACYALLKDAMGIKKLRKYLKKQDNAYWGPDISKKKLNSFKSNKLIKKNFIIKLDKNLKGAAKIISQGKTLLFCYGKMEFGQRALGHRSILCDPSNSNQIKKINQYIKKRDFWMPFTPSIIDKDYTRYVINKKKIQSNYMTICFDTTDLAKKHLKAAIHPYDFTIRPQLVTKSTCKTYYQLISEFKKITGIGALLNTSLNVSDKPIINQPDELLKEVIRRNINSIDAIFIEDTLFIKKN